jgi:small subunit ribosomal protein S1
VLDIDRDRQRISLGLKQTQADPWQSVIEAYDVGDVVEGRVTKVVTFGAFVEIHAGVEGLVHISELAAHHVENPREVVNQGDVLAVRVIEIDADRRRLSLSLKRVADSDPIQHRLPDDIRGPAPAAEEPALEGEEPVDGVRADEEPVAEVEAQEEPVAEVQAQEEPVAEVQAQEEPVDGVRAEEEPLAEVQAQEEPVAEVQAQEKPVEEVQSQEEPAAEVREDEAPAEPSEDDAS